MRVCVLTIVLMLAAGTGPALAQQAGLAPAARVTFILQVQSRIQAEGADLSELPLSLMERLDREGALQSLTLRGGAVRGMPSDLRIEFGFSTMEAFRTWYTSTSTRELMRSLEALGPGIRYSLEVERAPSRAGTGGP